MVKILPNIPAREGQGGITEKERLRRLENFSISPFIIKKIAEEEGMFEDKIREIMNKSLDMADFKNNIRKNNPI
ncbi:MAG: hypothetical protein GY804_15025 [Alphaproteobacteria bacterium]|nr:hypothetical protein [Alphaproteobacteria bacterium]